MKSLSYLALTILLSAAQARAAMSDYALLTFDAEQNGVETGETGQLNFSITGRNTEPTTFCSSHNAVFFTAVKPTNSTVTASIPELAADGTSSSTITVTLLDSYGYPITNTRVILIAGDGHSLISPVMAMTDLIWGRATFQVTVTHGEAVTYFVKAGDDILSQNTVVQFSSRAASRRYSQVKLSPSTVSADGTSGATVTITLRDAKNTPIPGRSVFLDFNRSETTVVNSRERWGASRTTNSLGQASFTFTNTVAERVHFTVIDAQYSVALQSSAITFVPGPASLSTVSTSGMSATADGATASTVSVHLIDAHGNRIANKRVFLAAKNGESTVSPEFATTDSSGYADFQVRDYHVETVTYQVYDLTDDGFLTQTASVAFVASHPVTVTAGSPTNVDLLAGSTAVTTAGAAAPPIPVIPTGKDSTLADVTSIHQRIVNAVTTSNTGQTLPVADTDAKSAISPVIVSLIPKATTVTVAAGGSGVPNSVPLIKSGGGTSIPSVNGISALAPSTGTTSPQGMVASPLSDNRSQIRSLTSATLIQTARAMFTATTATQSAVSAIASIAAEIAVPPRGVAPQITASPDGTHTCALSREGNVYCWGDNNEGQLGNNSTGGFSKAPVLVSGPGGNGSLAGIIGIAAGGFHTCALSAGGNVYCWGDNSYGQLGNPDPSSSSNTPVRVLGPRGAGSLSRITAIAAGKYHTCALTSDGNVYCWGDNSYGQLGNATWVEVGVPVPVEVVGGITGTTNLSSINGIGAGGGNTCAVSSTGDAYCWGYNTSGELGDNSMSNSNTPVEVQPDALGSLSGVTEINAGGGNTCAVSTSGNAYCWGSNSSGLLGNNSSSTDQSLIPVEVAGVGGTGFLSGLTAVAGGADHSCALASDGNVYCWGSNASGQLGDSSSASTSYSPIEVDSLPGTQSVSAGAGYTCALTIDGNVYCWGANASGQLGNDSTTGTDTPGEVVGMDGIGFLTL